MVLYANKKMPLLCACLSVGYILFAGYVPRQLGKTINDLKLKCQSLFASCHQSPRDVLSQKVELL